MPASSMSGNFQRRRLTLIRYHGRIGYQIRNGTCMRPSAKRPRTSSYRFTVESYDSPRIEEYRTWVKVWNDLVRRGLVSGIQYRMKVCPRLGKNNPNRHLYARKAVNWRPNSQNIKREHGQYFDVYLHRNWNASPAFHDFPWGKLGSIPSTYDRSTDEYTFY